MDKKCEHKDIGGVGDVWHCKRCGKKVDINKLFKGKYNIEEVIDE